MNEGGLTITGSPGVIAGLWALIQSMTDLASAIRLEAAWGVMCTPLCA